ncbi:hypothetical protein D3C84_1163930 [compost metagenome]
MEQKDLMDVVNLTNNLIMFDDQMKVLESKYSLGFRVLNYDELLVLIKDLDNKLFELIESKGA